MISRKTLPKVRDNKNGIPFFFFFYFRVENSIGPNEQKSTQEISRSRVADLRIKQEPVALNDRDRGEKLAERLSGDVYPGRGFDAGSYGTNSDHLPHEAQLGPMVSMPPIHPPTPDQSRAPVSIVTSAVWNTKINKASTVTTIDGGECHPLSLHPDQDRRSL